MTARSIREARARRKRRIRGRIEGSAGRPRVSVFRSNRAIYAQIVDDGSAATLAAARSTEVEGAGLKKAEIAKKVGELLAQRAKDKGIERVVFDRSGYLYHGRVKALAEGAREGGLVF
jgi:large subunit ribosomal protein L18